jgi:nicotinate phosphoribosyltransferase
MIITSILDTDFYKLSIQNFIWTLYPNVEVEYAFHNRDKSMVYTVEAFHILVNEIVSMSKLELTSKEYRWMLGHNIFNPGYMTYLSEYKFDPSQVNIELVDGQLDIRIKGKWVDTVLWEVPLMALISEVYFEHVDKNWNKDYDLQARIARNKANDLTMNDCIFTDFGTRRRRTKETQEIVVSEMKHTSGFNGTSNPYFAMKYDVRAVGTMAHEVICGLSALESMNHPNKVTMEKWREVYGEKLSIFLPDTYGIDSFIKDFDKDKTVEWLGVRHDSGCPFEFTDKILAHYETHKIDARTKTIVFSDSLDVPKAIELSKVCRGKITCMFGIGTHFTNDYKKIDGTKSKPMNMVIKLVKCNGVNVCKLSQNPDKAMGDPEAIRIMQHLHFGASL